MHKVGWVSWLEVGIGPMDGLIMVQKRPKMPQPFASENGNSIFSPERKKPKERHRLSGFFPDKPTQKNLKLRKPPKKPRLTKSTKKPSEEVHLPI